MRRWFCWSCLCLTSSVDLICCLPGCWKSAPSSWRRSSVDCSTRLCAPVMCRSLSNWHTSCRYSKRLVLTTQTWRIFDPSPTSRSFPSCWNTIFCGGNSSISRSTIFFRVCSPPIASVSLQKLRLQECYRISWWHSTVATWQHWPCWTCLLHSTWSITASICAISVSYDISGAAHSWISQYWTDRQQCIWHAGMQSTHEFIKFGESDCLVRNWLIDCRMGQYFGTESRRFLAARGCDCHVMLTITFFVNFYFTLMTQLFSVNRSVLSVCVCVRVECYCCWFEWTAHSGRVTWIERCSKWDQ